MNLFSQSPLVNVTISVEEVILNLVLACILGVLVAGVYRLTNRHKALSTSFMNTLVILAMVVALVMMIIGNSVARAFSLVGALSIIRFRTAIKDNRDIAFVFFALAAGMAAGVSSYTLAIFGVGTILVLLLLMDYVQFGSGRKGLYILRFQFITTDTDEQLYAPVFKEFLASHRRISVKTVRMGQFIEHTYLVRMKKGMSDQELIAQLSALEGMERVNMIAEESEGDL